MTNCGTSSVCDSNPLRLPLVLFWGAREGGVSCRPNQLQSACLGSEGATALSPGAESLRSQPNERVRAEPTSDRCRHLTQSDECKTYDIRWEYSVAALRRP